VSVHVGGRGPGHTSRKSSASPAFSIVRTSFTADADSSGWNGWTARERVLASSLTDISATQLRVSVKASPTGQLKIAKMYIGLKGTGTYDFASTPTQILFSGSGSILIPTGTVQASDAFTFAYDGTSDLVISMYHDAAAGYAGATDTSRSTLWQKAGDDAATLAPAGGGTGSTFDIIWLIEAA
jgi:hypothetical protein